MAVRLRPSSVVLAAVLSVVAGLTAAANAQSFYVANTTSGDIQRVNPDGTKTTYATGFNQPAGLAVDTLGNLYVANRSSAAGARVGISKVTPSGVVSDYASNFAFPAGLTIDGQNNLFISSQGRVPSLQSPTLISRLAPDGTNTALANETVPGVPGTINGPSGVALDASNAVYFSDGNDSRVIKLGPTGASVFATGFKSPGGLAFDTLGNLYVAERTGSTISRVTPAGTVSTFVTGLTTPTGLTFGQDGNLYVTSSQSNTISRITPTGDVSAFATGLNGPSAIVVPEPTAIAVLAGGSVLLLRRTRASRRA